jgi:hypothetical protein
VAAGVAAIVAPWAIRNWLVFGRPIVTTTHGGYTLLLGNNPVFHREELNKPWGTVWSGDSLARWNTAIETEMRQDGIRPHDEVARDRWMSRRAWRNIRDEPAAFLSACWFRFLRFWNVAPLGAVRQSLPAPLVWGVGAYYSVVTIGFLAGLVLLRREEWPRWMPPALLIASFTLVHLLYWSNARMRAPLIPAIALLATYGMVRVANVGRSR